MTVLPPLPSADVAIVPDFAIIPAGSFAMGENDEDKFANDTERPRHEVAIPCDFGLGVFPVTVGEFRAFRPGHAPRESADLPAVGINWIDATAYCEWLGEHTGRTFRLPTEAEWEYACRAGSRDIFAHGNTLDTNQANYLYSEHGMKVGRGHRTPCGVFPPNAFGLFDMHGNVCEWVQDTWHPDYIGAPNDSSAWIEGGRRGWRVIRGGAWDYLPRLLRTSWRDALPETIRRDNVGFRVACDL